MKNSMRILMVALAMSAVGCATKYPVTQIDRELALKLADKAPVIVTTPPPVINVNNYNGGSHQAPQAQVDQYGRGEKRTSFYPAPSDQE